MLDESSRHLSQCLNSGVVAVKFQAFTAIIIKVYPPNLFFYKQTLRETKQIFYHTPV